MTCDRVLGLILFRINGSVLGLIKVIYVFLKKSNICLKNLLKKNVKKRAIIVQVLLH